MSHPSASPSTIPASPSTIPAWAAAVAYGQPNGTLARLGRRVWFPLGAPPQELAPGIYRLVFRSSDGSRREPGPACEVSPSAAPAAASPDRPVQEWAETTVTPPPAPPILPAALGPQWPAPCLDPLTMLREVRSMGHADLSLVIAAMQAQTAVAVASIQAEAQRSIASTQASAVRSVEDTRAFYAARDQAAQQAGQQVAQQAAALERARARAAQEAAAAFAAAAQDAAVNLAPEENPVETLEGDPWYVGLFKSVGTDAVKELMGAGSDWLRAQARAAGAPLGTAPAVEPPA